MKIKALVLNKKGKLVEKEIHNTLEDLQKIVEGYIEMPYLSGVFAENDIDIIINEEGKLINLTPSIAVIDKENGGILDIVHGRCIFTSHDEDGETIGLNEEQIMIVERELKVSVDLINPNTFDSFTVKALFV